MLLVRQVEGPARIAIGRQATYQATVFNQSNPAAADLARINWQVNLDGREIRRPLAVGAIFKLDIAPDWLGKALTIMPFANTPTAAVAVTTQVEAAQQPPPPQPETPAFQVATRYDSEQARCYARVNLGEEFYVGSRVPYQGRIGLSNIYLNSGPRYDPSAHEAAEGHWAFMIYPTALCESEGYYNRLNTYDRAAFTFGLLQWAAHTANANFVLLFRQLLTLPDAAGYFPDLTLRNGHIQQRRDAGWLDLEGGGDDLPRLTAYLNPDPNTLTPRVQQVSAKFVNWSNSSRAARARQDSFAFASYQANMADYAQRYDLDGREDLICLVVADIRHQGRATHSAIQSALAAADPLAALLSIGAESYAERIATLQAAMSDLVSQGKLGRLRYASAANSFVAPDPPSHRG